MATNRVERRDLRLHVRSRQPLSRRIESRPRFRRDVNLYARTEDGPISEPAAKAVKAMREVFPDMVFDQVEEVS